jgi:hypothetical protein
MFDGLVSRALGFLHILYPRKANFLKAIRSDIEALQKCWPDYASDVVSMYFIAATLVVAWDHVKAEFAATKTFKDKNKLIAMIYQPWELCDDVFTKWNEANEITLPAKKTLREVEAKKMFFA